MQIKQNTMSFGNNLGEVLCFAFPQGTTEAVIYTDLTSALQFNNTLYCLGSLKTRASVEYYFNSIEKTVNESSVNTLIFKNGTNTVTSIDQGNVAGKIGFDLCLMTVVAK